MSLMSTPYAKFHKLTKVARNYCFHYDKASENCGPLRLEEKTRNRTANQRKTTFLHFIVRLVVTRPSSNPTTNGVHSFRSLQRFLAET